MVESIDTFTVTILGWEKWNSQKKRGHTCFLFSTRFFDDAKIAALTAQEKCAFIWLLTRCGDETRATITATAKQMRSAVGATTVRVESVLGRLQQLQLLSIDNSTPLLKKKRREEKGKEEKRIADGVSRPPSGDGLIHLSAEVESGQQLHIEVDPKTLDRVEAKLIAKAKTDANRATWESYRDAYHNRYNVDPVRNAKVNANIAQFVTRVGADDAPHVVKFYVEHNDSFYVRSMHPVSLALRDAEGLRTQWAKGRAITQSDVRRFEKALETRSTMDRIDSGELDQ